MIAMIITRDIPAQSATLTVWQRFTGTVEEVAKRIFEGLYAIYDWIRPINPVTGERQIHLLPFCFEKWMGSLYYPSMVAKSGGEIFETDRVHGHYAKLVHEVGEELAVNSPRKELEFEFKLIDSKVQNAWCLPGGKIGINLGLIQKMEADGTDYGLGYEPILKEKIAAVMSHEITHATARHAGRALEFRLFVFAAIVGAKYAVQAIRLHQYDKEIEEAQDPAEKARLRREREEVKETGFLFDFLTDLTLGGLGLCKSRSHELEADKYGMHLMDKTAINPGSAVWLMHFFEKHHSHDTGFGWLDWMSHLFSSHPTPKERLQANIETLQSLSKSPSTTI
jgi:predicted Zn-dependent protease